jgi:transcriptional regulator NrdR family protein
MKKEGQVCRNCIVKRKGHTEDFDERKVYGSVYAACASAHYDEHKCEKISEKITGIIKKFIITGKIVPSSEIRRKIEKELGRIDKELAFFYEHHLPNLRKL